MSPKTLSLLRTFAPLLGIAALAVVMLVVAPAVLSPFRLNSLGKYTCWAIAAVGIGLAWGRGGMLVLGQGVFFGLGGYSMAMHLKLEAAGPDGVPDFMLLYGDGTMPAFWEPFRSGPFTIFAILALPAIAATVLGWAIFKRRVKGAYFAILTQAMAVVAPAPAFSVMASASITSVIVSWSMTSTESVPATNSAAEPLIATDCVPSSIASSIASIEKLTEVWLAGIVTDAGTVASVESLLKSVTVSVRLSVALLRVTVAVVAPSPAFSEIASASIAIVTVS